MMRITPNLLVFCQVCAGATSNQQIKLAARKDCSNNFSWSDIAYEKKSKMVLFIFAYGKIVLTGAKVQDEAHAAFENIPVHKEIRKNQQWHGRLLH
ncbi:hypothetical protein GW17_00012472 [Ensete ventricosum]|uniref:Uncharacterized protein n=1 Tax=Ensete ventricosum TaxID=4639 RepID=A0A427ASU7_ENSVE|nr:hypothetical protein B296_00018696 [Ensete ventricosum]RWW23290.1 hypothetical protein GW17_00012472 [Ensete ventricosum]RZR87591.1 hypothetical protein BHM03_00015048 [Ensete ventricosum]